jgi:hypothetical protein
MPCQMQPIRRGRDLGDVSGPRRRGGQFANLVQTHQLVRPPRVHAKVPSTIEELRAGVAALLQGKQGEPASRDVPSSVHSGSLVGGRLWMCAPVDGLRRGS